MSFINYNQVVFNSIRYSIMFGISFPELIIVFTVILLVFGPNKLPEIARSFGSLSGMLKRESDKLRRDFYNSVYTPAEDFKQSLREEIKELANENIVANKLELDDKIQTNETATNESEIKQTQSDSANVTDNTVTNDDQVPK
jgi:TatA/E family protein of Tat protein translocase